MQDQVPAVEKDRSDPTPNPATRRFLTLSQACQILGVSDTTLRDWTDAGKIKAFITPGGHRRYAETDLNAFIDAQPRPRRTVDLIERLQNVRVEYHILTQDYARTRPWYTKMDADARAILRDQCRRLIELMVAHIRDPHQRSYTVEASKALGRDLGADLARLNFTLAEAIEAFILYRNPTMDSVNELVRSNEQVDRAVLRGVQVINAIIDNVLLGIVEQHPYGQASHAAIVDLEHEP